MRAQQLGVQVHCLRHQVAADGLPATLDRIRALGLSSIELVRFPGCRGNRWGDFGAAADLNPRGIAADLAAAGLHCPSVMVSEPELAADRLADTLDWVASVGCRCIVLTAIHSAAPCEPRYLDVLQGHAERCRQAGFEFILHTQPELWNPAGGTPPIQALLASAAQSSLRLEYDPTGAIQFDADPIECLRRRRGGIHAVHLRDARTPAAPVPYLPATPLGTGSIDWPALLDVAEASDVDWYFLEMEVADRHDTLRALEQSLAFLRQGPLLRTSSMT